MEQVPIFLFLECSCPNSVQRKIKVCVVEYTQISKCITGYDTKSTSKKIKILYILLKLLFFKGHYQQSEKTVYRMGENICKWKIW